MQRFLELIITLSCNLNCNYCYERKSVVKSCQKNPISFRTGKAAIDLFLSNSYKAMEDWISFLGGEPLTEFHRIRDLVEYIKRRYTNRNISILIVTNGLLLDSEKLHFIKTNGIFLKISVDALKAKELYQNNNKFVRIIKDASQYNNFAVTITITDDLISVYDLFKYLVSFGIKRFYFNFDFLFSNFNATSINILQRELGKISDFIVSRKHYKNIFISYLHSKKEQKFCQLDTDGIGMNTKLCFMDLYEEGNLYIMPNGDIFPCSIGNFISSKDKYSLFRIGNINTTNYSIIKANVFKLENRVKRLNKTNSFCIIGEKDSKKRILENILKKEYEHFNRTIANSSVKQVAK